MYQVEKAQEKDFDEILDLWIKTFNDKESFIKDFLSSKEKDHLVIREGCILSYLCAIKTKGFINQKEHDFIYIVAALTKEDQRKKGLMSIMLNYVKEHYKKEVVLYPQDRNFYKNRGFSSFLVKCFITEKKQITEDKNYSLDKINDIYNKSIMSANGVFRDSFTWKDLLLGYYLVHTDNAYALINKKTNAILEATALDKYSAIKLLNKIGGEIKVIPNTALEKYLLSLNIEYTYEPCGMYVKNPIYIIEQY